MATMTLARDRRSRRKVALLALLLLLLALASYLVYYFAVNKNLPMPLPAAEGETLAAPQYLYSISGTGPDALGRPIGVAVGKDGRVYVSDVTRQRVSVFTGAGKYLGAFNKINDGKNTQLKAPVHLAFDAKGDLYVSDRILDGVYVFDTEGKFLRKFQTDPATMKGWSPLALFFGPDGRFYMSDVGDTKKHQMFVFDAAGAKVLQWGKTTQVEQATDLPGDFYFPNGIAVSKAGLIFVADGNNRRVQVFGKDGKFQYFIGTSGIPRGIWLDEGNQRLIVSDALAHQVDIYTLKGAKLVSFGGGGTGPGQFQYPNDVTLDTEGRILIADRENHQVQVWGWPKAAVPAQVAAVAQYWPWCFAPLLLLPLLLFARKRQYVLTPDFVDGLVAAEDVGLMTAGKLKWLAPVADHETHYAGRVESGVDLGELIYATEHSDADAREVMERMTVDMPTAVLLSMAQRPGRLATDDPDLRRLALMLDIEVVDSAEFSERTGRETKG